MKIRHNVVVGVVAATVVLSIGAPAAGAPTPLATQPQAAALLARPKGGTVVVTGLQAAIDAGAVPQWPVELTPTKELKAACAAKCTEWQRLDYALGRAAEWMAAFPQKQLRFDAAMALSQIRQTVDSDALRLAFERAGTVADRDADHSHHRFWVPNFSTPADYTSRWHVPGPNEERVNSNRVVDEALYCVEYGFRPETLRYMCGPMRDDGGYQTTHALWALGIANQNGCLKGPELERCVRDMQQELLSRQPASFTPTATLDIDLYAERLLYPVLTGMPDPIVNRWAHVLIDLQTPDGSWGIPAAQQDPYYRYHATMVATWALAEWFRRVDAHSHLRP